MSNLDPQHPARLSVTGGAGFIGSHLVDALVQRGFRVTVLDNLFRGQKDFIAEHIRSGTVEFIEGDVRDAETVRRAVQGAEAVFHLAAQSNVLGAVADLDYSFTTNVVGTFNVLQVAQEAGVRRVVFTSSREVYGDPPQLPVAESTPLNAKNPYGASKVAGEVYCRVFAGRGLQVARLCLANVYGPRDTGRVIPIFIHNALRGVPLTLYGGQQTIDFIWIGDAVCALLAAGFEDWPLDEAVNVGSGVGTPIRALAERVLHATGAKMPIEVLPARSAEVVHFVAAVERLRALLPSLNGHEPLARLPEVVDYWRGRAT